MPRVESTPTHSPTIDVGAETWSIGAARVDIDDTDDEATDQKLTAVCARSATRSGRWASPPTGNGVPNTRIRRYGRDLKSD